MNIGRSVSWAIALALTSTVAAGCATTQTSAFRRMSAEEHERAAQGPMASTDDASDHLSAARSLRETESTACADVPQADRDQGPFAHREWLAGVYVVRDRYRFAKGPLEPAGVTVELRATPGVTEQWIGRLIQCHLAHQAVVGDRVAEQSCPLSMEGTRVNLSSTLAGFRVTITTKDIAVARTLIDTCQAIAN